MAFPSRGRSGYRAALLLFAAAAAGGGAATAETLAEKSERAKLWMAQQRFAEAAGLYEELTKAVPGNPGLLLNLGMARHMAGQDAAAIAPLEAALRLQAIPPAMLFLGSSYLRLGQPAKAVGPLKRFVAADPNHQEARQMLADAAASTGNHAEAAVHLTKLAEWTPDQPALWYSLGRTWQEVAAGHMEKLPQDSGYWLALAAENRNKRSQSRAGFLLYRKAIGKLPKQRGLHAAVAEIYRATGHEDWAKVEDGLEAGLGAPACKPVVTLECHFAAGRFREVLMATLPVATMEARYWKSRAAGALAQAAFAKLAALGPSVAASRYEAESKRDDGRHQEAVEAWRAALALAPADQSLQFELANSLVAARDFDGAQEVATALLAADPAGPDFNFLQGEILMSQQQPERALPFLAKAVEADAKVLPLRASYGRALMLAGRGAEAVPHLEAALPLDTDASLHFQLARAYQAAGKAELAKAMMAKYQALRAREEEDRKKIEAEAEITAPR